MFDKSVYVRRRKTLLAKMANSAADGKGESPCLLAMLRLLPSIRTTATNSARTAPGCTCSVSTSHFMQP